jgi:hypothetical protein
VWIHVESRLEFSRVPRSLCHIAVQSLPAHHLSRILSHVRHQSSWLPIHPLHVALILWLPLNQLRKPDPAPAPHLPATVPSFLHHLPNTLHPLYPTESFNTKFKRRKTMHTRSKGGIVVPKRHFNLSASVAISPIPSNYLTALKDLHWFNAMREEYNALMDQNMWCLVPKPAGANVVSGKWIFQHKNNSNGSLAQYKAHWVICGFTQ